MATISVFASRSGQNFLDGLKVKNNARALSSPKPTFFLEVQQISTYEPPHDKTNKMACTPSEDSDQPGHPSSLIRVFTVRMKKAWVHGVHSDDSDQIGPMYRLS